MPKIDVLLRVKGLIVTDEFTTKLRAGDETAFIELTNGLFECITQPNLGEPEGQIAWPCDSVEVEDVNDVA